MDEQIECLRHLLASLPLDTQRALIPCLITFVEGLSRTEETDANPEGTETQARSIGFSFSIGVSRSKP